MFSNPFQTKYFIEKQQQYLIHQDFDVDFVNLVKFTIFQLLLNVSICFAADFVKSSFSGLGTFQYYNNNNDNNNIKLCLKGLPVAGNRFAARAYLRFVENFIKKVAKNSHHDQIVFFYHYYFHFYYYYYYFLVL